MLDLPLPWTPCQVSRTGWHWVSEAGVLMVGPAAETTAAPARRVARRTEALVIMMSVSLLEEGVVERKEGRTKQQQRTKVRSNLPDTYIASAGSNGGRRRVCECARKGWAQGSLGRWACSAGYIDIERRSA